MLSETAGWLCPVRALEVMPSGEVRTSQPSGKQMISQSPTFGGPASKRTNPVACGKRHPSALPDLRNTVLLRTDG